jgi:Helix-turn-helix domain
MGEEKRAFKGVWICAAIFLDEKLTPAEKILLAEIDSLTTHEQGCYASNTHFAKRLGVTESRVNHVVARLTREGYIIRVCYDGRISHRVVASEYSSNPATSRRLKKVRFFPMVDSTLEYQSIWFINLKYTSLFL